MRFAKWSYSLMGLLDTVLFAWADGGGSPGVLFTRVLCTTVYWYVVRVECEEDERGPDLRQI